MSDPSVTICISDADSPDVEHLRYSLFFFCPRQMQINNGVGRNSTATIPFYINLKNERQACFLFYIVCPQRNQFSNQTPLSGIMFPRQRCSIFTGLTSSMTTKKSSTAFVVRISHLPNVFVQICSLFHTLHHARGCLIPDFSFTYQGNSH